MACGVYPNFANCQLSCTFNTAGGSYRSLDALLTGCFASNDLVYRDCISTYLFNCQLVDPTALSSSSQQYSSTSAECAANDFSYENLKNGFRDYYEYFFMLFVCFVVIRLFKMVR